MQALKYRKATCFATLLLLWKMHKMETELQASILVTKENRLE